MLDALTLAFLILLGVAAGILGSLVGAGGGFLVVPLLILAYAMPPRLAVGTSMTMTVFTGLSAVLAYMRQRRIDWRLGAVTAGLTVPASALGASATNLVPALGLQAVFGFVLAAIALRIGVGATHAQPEIPRTSEGENGWARRVLDVSGREFRYAIRLVRAAPLLLGAGFLSGFLGVGGGLMIVPIFFTVMGVPVHVAVATSMFLMLFTSGSGAAVHWVNQNVVLEFAGPLIAGILVGAQVGPRVAYRLRRRWLERVIAGLLFTIGLWMVVRTVLAP